MIIRSKRSSLLARRPRLLGVLVVQSVVQSIQILSWCVSVIPFFLSCCLTSTWVRRPLKQPLNTSTTTNERAYLVRRPRERVICRHGEIIRRLADMTHRILVPSATGEQARVRLVHFVQEQAAAQHLAWRRCTRQERERERER